MTRLISIPICLFLLLTSISNKAFGQNTPNLDFLQNSSSNRKNIEAYNLNRSIRKEIELKLIEAKGFLKQTQTTEKSKIDNIIKKMGDLDKFEALDKFPLEKFKKPEETDEADKYPLQREHIKDTAKELNTKIQKIKELDFIKNSPSIKSQANNIFGKIIIADNPNSDPIVPKGNLKGIINNFVDIQRNDLKNLISNLNPKSNNQYKGLMEMLEALEQSTQANVITNINNFKGIATNKINYLRTHQLYSINDDFKRILEDFASNSLNIQNISTASPAQATTILSALTTANPRDLKNKLMNLFNLDQKESTNSYIKYSTEISTKLRALEDRLKPIFVDLKIKAIDNIRKNIGETLESSPPKAATLIRQALRILPFESSLVSSTVDECENLHGLQAETNCTFFMDIRAAVEYIGDNDFSDSFGRLELRTRSYLVEFGNDHEEIEAIFLDESEESEVDLVGRYHVLLSGALTSRNTDKASGTGQATSEKVVEGKLGLQIDFLDFYRKEKGKTVPTHTLAFLGEGGFFDPTNDPNNQFTKLTGNHFVGLRLYYRARSRFNGASIDAGWGVNEFFDNQDPRIKVRTYIPYRVLDETSGSNFKVFGAIETDVGKGRDELKLILGVSLPIDQVAKGIGSIFSGGN